VVSTASRLIIGPMRVCTIRNFDCTIDLGQADLTRSKDGELILI
jgi:hypothetical protein